jgi:hypothetical protein
MTVRNYNFVLRGGTVSIMLACRVVITQMHTYFLCYVDRPAALNPTSPGGNIGGNGGGSEDNRTSRVIHGGPYIAGPCSPGDYVREECPSFRARVGNGEWACR